MRAMSAWLELVAQLMIQMNRSCGLRGWGDRDAISPRWFRVALLPEIGDLVLRSRRAPVKTLMFYDLAADGLTKVQANFAAHRARIDEFHRKGTLLMAGPYGSPPVGALGVFTSREAAEEFMKDDPFIVNGVVGKWTLHDWSEVLVTPGGA